jgi:uroporphyrin-III C-methyltransferase/precorrin-2 dehydrogenase/sirohydrochlorin ferrochelatase/uroporphyrin-III C-methyltransferase
MSKQGFVALVGAGPGDPELLTLKALRHLQKADIVLYDRLVSKQILDMIPHGVSRISVGKASGRHCVSQDQINGMLLNLARAGHTVVRLKGGDPYLFGRGSEEASTLRQHAIPFEVVPGVSAAVGAAAYSGIPLTHRGVSRRVQFVTGHLMHDERLDIDWSKLADSDSTLVIYMGLANAGLISAGLIGAGLAPTTPCALVENATTAQQRRIVTDLCGLVSTLDEHAVQAPALIIIGEVVGMADQLDWFQRQLDQQLNPDVAPVAFRP